MTVTLKGKKYTNIQEFLRQRAGTNLYEQSDSEHLPKHPGIAAERGKGHTADQEKKIIWDYDVAKGK